jgi:hypothetical protein
MPGYAPRWNERSLGSTLQALVDEQDGVLARAQLFRSGVTRDKIRTHVRARRWRLLAGRVVVMHRGPMTFRQRCWVAVLAAGPDAALCSLTGAALDGLTGFENDAVHVLVPKGTQVPAMPGVRVHESRRFVPADVHPARRPPRTTTARSVLDAAVWSRRPAMACAIASAAVQQRLVTVPQLLDVLDRAGAVRHRRLLRAVLEDIAGGSHSFAEIGMARLCRRSGLPPPQRQAVRCDRAGRRRYLDLFWPDHSVCVEVDGSFHWEAGQWRRDLDRQNDLVLDGLTVLRFPSATVRLHPETIIAQLTQALQLPLSA